MALCFAAFGDNRRRLVGCDLDAHRIAVARQALGTLNADVTVADIRHFELPPAGLILILDVLQYLPAAEQSALLKRCCSALTPDGILVFRVHDRERGLWSAITMAFERLIFACERVGFRPQMFVDRRVPRCAGERRYAVGRAPFPESFAPGPHPIRRKKTFGGSCAMMVRFLRLVGHRPFRFVENTLTTYHDRWLNFLILLPVAFLD